MGVFEYLATTRLGERGTMTLPKKVAATSDWLSPTP